MPKIIGKTREGILKLAETALQIEEDSERADDIVSGFINFDPDVEDDETEDLMEENAFWQSEWLEEYCKFVEEQAAVARSSVANEKNYVENQGVKYDQAELILERLDEIRNIEKPFVGRIRPLPLDGCDYYSGVFVIDFTNSLFKMEADGFVEQMALFRDMVNLCDDFNVFMLDPSDEKHDTMRCIFAIFNIEHTDRVFGNGNEETFETDEDSLS